MLRVGCSAGAVMICVPIAMSVVREALAFRTLRRVLSAPADASHVVARTSETVPPAALAALEPVLQVRATLVHSALSQQ
jgi:hypothetical protein